MNWLKNITTRKQANNTVAITPISKKYRRKPKKTFHVSRKRQLQNVVIDKISLKSYYKKVSQSERLSNLREYTSRYEIRSGPRGYFLDKMVHEYAMGKITTIALTKKYKTNNVTIYDRIRLVQLIAEKEHE